MARLLYLLIHLLCKITENSRKVQNMNKIKQKIITNARKQLDEAQLNKKNIAEDYKIFLQSLANSLCPICKLPLEIIGAKEDENSFSYKYKCGHGWEGRTFKEEIKFRDSIGIKLKQVGRGKWVKKVFQGFKSSGDPKLSEGVDVLLVADVEKNEYHHIVKDNKTGRILHNEHEPLDKHKAK